MRGYDFREKADKHNLGISRNIKNKKWHRVSRAAPVALFLYHQGGTNHMEADGMKEISCPGQGAGFVFRG